jgi:hypothetical protein
MDDLDAQRNALLFVGKASAAIAADLVDELGLFGAAYLQEMTELVAKGLFKSLEGFDVSAKAIQGALDDKGNYRIIASPSPPHLD